LASAKDVAWSEMVSEEVRRQNATSTHTEEKMKKGDEFWNAWALAAYSARGVNCVNLMMCGGMSLSNTPNTAIY